MNLTKEEFAALDKEISFIGRGISSKARIRLINMLKQLSDIESTLWMRAWLCRPGTASRKSLKRSLGWTDAKISKTLMSLCNKGWAYRVMYPRQHGDRLWILPFLEPLEPELRTVNLLQAQHLPDEIQRVLPSICLDVQ